MIIEFFGPSGSGKTTLAHALADRLRDRGYVAKVIICYRPRNKGDGWDRFGILSVFSRIYSAIIAVSSAFISSIDGRNDIRMSNKIIRSIPPKSIIWRIRIWQYIVRLSRFWKQAQKSADITIFDQGFTQVIGSLAMFNGAADDPMIARALYFVPAADLMVRMVVPREVVEARLQARMRREAAAERLFEVGVVDNMNAFDIFDKIVNVLQGAQLSVVSVRPVDQESTASELCRVEEEIVARLSRIGSPFINQMRGGSQCPA